MTNKQRSVNNLGLFLVMTLLLLFLSACNKEALSDKKTEVEGKGVTYTFQLPNGWEKQENYQEIYGDTAVFGAEDTKSHSNMVVTIGSKEQIPEEGFGERIRKELAAQNGYTNEEDVYYDHQSREGQEIYKYTFETRYQNKQVWGHYYSLFTEHGVLQFLYYSANDSSYEDRVKIIDQSIKTVKETAYDADKAEEEERASQTDSIAFSTNQYEVTIVGLGTLKSESEEPIVALRYKYTNKEATSHPANQWVKEVTVTQAGKNLEEVTLPSKSDNYDIVRLQGAAEVPVEKGGTVESVVLYKLNGQASLTFTLPSEATSKQTTYTLTLPK